MITRIWHGRTRPEHANAYLQFLLTDGTKDYRLTNGNLSVKVWRNEQPGECHFWTVTEWSDRNALIAFAGTDFEKAQYYPQDNGVLLEFEERVTHHESHDVSNARISSYIRQLEQLFHGNSWQGESFSEKLKDVDDTMAFAQPVPNVHSISEIVWHCIYWREVYLERAHGSDLKTRQGHLQNFLPLGELQEKGWPQLVAYFEQTQQAILKFLRTKQDNFLLQHYHPGHSFDHMTEGIVQHDIYHLGQIGLVKKILKETSAS